MESLMAANGIMNMGHSNLGLAERLRCLENRTRGFITAANADFRSTAALFMTPVPIQHLQRHDDVGHLHHGDDLFDNTHRRHHRHVPAQNLFLHGQPWDKAWATAQAAAELCRSDQADKTMARPAMTSDRLPTDRGQDKISQDTRKNIRGTMWPSFPPAPAEMQLKHPTTSVITPPSRFRIGVDMTRTRSRTVDTVSDEQHHWHHVRMRDTERRRGQRPMSEHIRQRHLQRTKRDGHYLGSAVVLNSAPRPSRRGEKRQLGGYEEDANNDRSNSPPPQANPKPADAGSGKISSDRIKNKMKRVKKGAKKASRTPWKSPFSARGTRSAGGSIAGRRRSPPVFSSPIPRDEPKALPANHDMQDTNSGSSSTHVSRDSNKRSASTLISGVGESTDGRMNAAPARGVAATHSTTRQEREERKRRIQRSTSPIFDSSQFHDDKDSAFHGVKALRRTPPPSLKPRSLAADMPPAAGGGASSTVTCLSGTSSANRHKARSHSDDATVSPEWKVANISRRKDYLQGENMFDDRHKAGTRRGAATVPSEWKMDKLSRHRRDLEREKIVSAYDEGFYDGCQRRRMDLARSHRHRVRRRTRRAADMGSPFAIVAAPPRVPHGAPPPSPFIYNSIQQQEHLQQEASPAVALLSPQFEKSAASPPVKTDSTIFVSHGGGAANNASDAMIRGFIARSLAHQAPTQELLRKLREVDAALELVREQRRLSTLNDGGATESAFQEQLEQQLLVMKEKLNEWAVECALLEGNRKHNSGERQSRGRDASRAQDDPNNHESSWQRKYVSALADDTRADCKRESVEIDRISVLSADSAIGDSEADSYHSAKEEVLVSAAVATPAAADDGNFVSELDDDVDTNVDSADELIREANDLVHRLEEAPDQARVGSASNVAVGNIDESNSSMLVADDASATDVSTSNENILGEAKRVLDDLGADEDVSCNDRGDDSAHSDDRKDEEGEETPTMRNVVSGAVDNLPDADDHAPDKHMDEKDASPRFAPSTASSSDGELRVDEDVLSIDGGDDDSDGDGGSDGGGEETPTVRNVVSGAVDNAVLNDRDHALETLVEEEVSPRLAPSIASSSDSENGMENDNDNGNSLNISAESAAPESVVVKEEEEEEERERMKSDKDGGASVGDDSCVDPPRLLSATEPSIVCIDDGAGGAANRVTVDAGTATNARIANAPPLDVVRVLLRGMEKAVAAEIGVGMDLSACFCAPQRRAEDERLWSSRRGNGFKVDFAATRVPRLTQADFLFEAADTPAFLGRVEALLDAYSVGEN